MIIIVHIQYIIPVILVGKLPAMVNKPKSDLYYSISFNKYGSNVAFRLRFGNVDTKLILLHVCLRSNFMSNFVLYVVDVNSPSQCPLKSGTLRNFFTIFHLQTKWACGHFFRLLCLYSFYNLED